MDKSATQRLKVALILVELHLMHGRIRSGLQRYLKLIWMWAMGYGLMSHHGTNDHTLLERSSTAQY